MSVRRTSELGRKEIVTCCIPHMVFRHWFEKPKKITCDLAWLLILPCDVRTVNWLANISAVVSILRALTSTKNRAGFRRLVPVLNTSRYAGYTYWGLQTHTWWWNRLRRLPWKNSKYLLLICDQYPVCNGIFRHWNGVVEYSKKQRSTKLVVKAVMLVKIIRILASLLRGTAQHLPLYHFSPAREWCSEMKWSESKRWKL